MNRRSIERVYITSGLLLMGGNSFGSGVIKDIHGIDRARTASNPSPLPPAEARADFGSTLETRTRQRRTLRTVPATAPSRNDQTAADWAKVKVSSSAIRNMGWPPEEMRTAWAMVSLVPGDETEASKASRDAK